MLHRKLKESQVQNNTLKHQFEAKDHECNILRQRANSNEAKLHGYEQAKRRVQQLESLLLRQQMLSDLHLNNHHMGPRGFGPDFGGGDGIC